MSHQRPGWAMPNGHIVRSQTESSLCEYLDNIPVLHEHWALSFDLPASPTEWRLFVPSILLTDLKCDDRATIIEPVNSLQIGGGVRRLQSFRKRFGREFFVIAIARRAWHRRIPVDAYDELFDIEDFEGLGNFLAGRSP